VEGSVVVSIVYRSTVQKEKKRGNQGLLCYERVLCFHQLQNVQWIWSTIRILCNVHFFLRSAADHVSARERGRTAKWANRALPEPPAASILQTSTPPVLQHAGARPHTLPRPDGSHSDRTCILQEVLRAPRENSRALKETGVGVVWMIQRCHQDCAAHAARATVQFGMQAAHVWGSATYTRFAAPCKPGRRG
jgi:hypothetical protein